MTIKNAFCHSFVLIIEFFSFFYNQLMPFAEEKSWIFYALRMSSAIIWCGLHGHNFIFTCTSLASCIGDFALPLEGLTGKNIQASMGMHLHVVFGYDSFPCHWCFPCLNSEPIDHYTVLYFSRWQRKSWKQPIWPCCAFCVLVCMEFFVLNQKSTWHLLPTQKILF